MEARGHGDFITHSSSIMKENDLPELLCYYYFFLIRYSASDLYQSEDKHFTSSLDSKYNRFKRVSHHRPAEPNCHARPPWSLPGDLL